MIHPAIRLLLPVVALAGCTAEPRSVAAPPNGTPAAATEDARLVPLAIETAQGRRQFMVEVAATPEEQARGLMFRPPLAPDRGMIFPFDAPRPAGFWMKNTPAPLDLLFIRADGTIARIAAMAEPYSLALIESGEPVAAVLEIAGGGAARAGIAEGDRVIWAGQPAGS